jgi:hypothetical protein
MRCILLSGSSHSLRGLWIFNYAGTQFFLLLLLMIILTNALLSPFNVAIRSRNVVKNNQLKSQQTWNARRHCMRSHVYFCFNVFIFSRFNILKWKRYRMLKLLIIYSKLKHTEIQNLISVFSSIFINTFLYIYYQITYGNLT